MRRTLKYSCLVFSLLITKNIFAVTESKLVQEINHINAEENALKTEIQSLKAELKAAKHLPAPDASTHTSAPEASPYEPANTPPPAHLPNEAEPHTQAEAEAKAEGLKYQYYGPRRFLHGITVTTSPYMGIRSAFSAADLLYEYPSMNEDLKLLRDKHAFELQLESVGDTLDNRAIIAFSGGVEGQLMTGKTYNGHAMGDINLTTAEIDISAMASRWANAFMALDYDDSPPQTGSRVTNSRIYLSRGFLTIGNLDATPLYFTVGQLYAPFGKYSSLMLSTPLTKSLARISARVAQIGVFTNGFYGAIYGYDGDRDAGPRRVFKQGGINTGYQADISANSSIDFGAGSVSNIADSQGIQSTGLDFIPDVQFGGFGVQPGANKLVHNVPAVDGHLEYTIGPFALIEEYIRATRPFAPTDMTFNGMSALISVVHSEINYTWYFKGRPIALGLVYGQTWESLALNLPKNTYAIVLSASIWKNTMLGLEFRHDRNYHATPLPSVTGAALPVPDVNIGGDRNFFIMQVGVYF